MLNQIIIKTLPLIPKSFVHIFAKKYIAGDSLEDAVEVTKKIQGLNGMTTIDVLGEFVTTKNRALHEMEMSSKVLDAIKDHNLRTYLSIKPTSLGLGLDVDFAYDNISYLVDKAKKSGQFVRIDMENSPFTTQTINTYKRLRNSGYDNVGIVFQSYMRRSESDITGLLDYKPSIRLCKGIYNEHKDIAFKQPDEIRNNYKKLLALMLNNGLYSGIATHDEELIRFALDEIKDRNLTNKDYEFQMLLGVRTHRRDELLKAGYPLRVYVPFGKDWYGYSTRRLKENPQMAGHIFRSIFSNN